MWAAYIDELGPPDAIRYGALPVPEPGPTDVLVRVHAVAVNPVDTMIRSGRYRTPLDFPFVIGRDLVGRVADVGSQVTGFAIGDPVWCNSLGHDGRQGAAAQYARVAADRLYPLAPGADPIELVAVAHPAATAYLALKVHAHLQPGETVLIAGAGGHVGRAATVLAVHAGAKVIATASADDLTDCRALGASVALDYHDPDLPRLIREAAPDGVDVHLDTSGHHDFVLAASLLARRGRVILMAGSGQRPAFPVRELYINDASVLGFAISNATTDDLAAAAAEINALVEEGLLAPRLIEDLPLSDAATAHARLETGQARGVRLILEPPNEEL